MRRHVADADLARLPTLEPPPRWSAGPWRIAPAQRADGHHNDAIAYLRRDDETIARVIVTSYDFDDRGDESLHRWIERKMRDEIRYAEQRATVPA